MRELRPREQAFLGVSVALALVFLTFLPTHALVLVGVWCVLALLFRGVL